MNLNNILLVCNTRKILPKAHVVENIFGINLGCEGIITTATGNPVSLITNKAQNAISTILSYSPIQSGSGDPSPQNIRPIEGWTEANLFGCGKNLYNDSTSTEGKYINDSGTLSTSAGYLASDYISVARKGVYITSGFIGSGTVAKHAFYDANKNFISVVNAMQNPITTPDNCAFVRLSIRTTGMTNVQFEAGSQATDYAPFITQTTITESLGGTYYGFTVDVERGVLRVTWGYIAEYDGEELSGRWISDRDVYSPNTSPTIGAEVAYELAAPLELPLTPQTVALLAGNNTIWCDGDSLSVTYRR